MVSKETVVIDKMGLHMRPANNFITAMNKYKSNLKNPYTQEIVIV